MYPFIKQYEPLTNLMMELWWTYQGQDLEPHESSYLVYRWLIQLVSQRFPGFQLFGNSLEHIQYDVPNANTFVGFTPAPIRSEVIWYVLGEPFLNRFAEIVKAVKSDPNIRPS